MSKILWELGYDLMISLVIVGVALSVIKALEAVAK